MEILAIVGRPNVGKSALFNRIIGRRVAIVHEQAGVTRDRVSAVAQYAGKTFEVIDTGGLAFLDDEKTRDALAAATRQQAEIAIEMASALILVVDVTTGLTPLDREVAARLRASGKPVFLAVNKVDNPQRERGVPEFAALGFEQMFPIAAIHGPGVESLVEAATAGFPAATATAAAAEAPTRVAIVGRPNVGKSSLVNCLLADTRTIVSEVPGTTRDSLDVPLTVERDGQPRPYVLVDTAGLRHQRRIKTSVDQFGLMRAQDSIRHCDVAVLVLDARDGVTQQDKHIGGLVAEARRGCVILVNKWDLVREEDGPKSEKRREQHGKSRPARRVQDPEAVRRAEHLARVRRGLFFLDWAAVLFASAKTGERVRGLFRLVDRVRHQLQQRVDTPRLNQLLGRAQEAYPPPVRHGKRLRIYYAVQSDTAPPTFSLFVNDPRCVTPSYERYLVARLRATWGFEGCPVQMRYRAKAARRGAGPRKNPRKSRRFS